MHRYMGRKISLVIRYADFETFSRQTTVQDLTNDTHMIYDAVLRVMDGVRLRDRVRLLGVCLSDLTRDPCQMPLIEEERKRRSILRTMDSVNDKYGELALAWGSYVMQKRDVGVISPSWRPSGVKSVELK